VTRKIYL